MNVSKPRPSDHPLLIIYVVGGVSAMEVRQVKEAVGKAKSDLKVRYDTGPLFSANSTPYRGSELYGSMASQILK